MPAQPVSADGGTDVSTDLRAADPEVRHTSADRREQILAAARTVIACHGLDATTEAVARAAGRRGEEA